MAFMAGVVGGDESAWELELCDRKSSCGKGSVDVERCCVFDPYCKV